MTLEEYKQKLSELRSEAKKAEFALAKEYALYTNKVKVGDVITDHQGSIKVEEIFIDPNPFISSAPECFYYGIELLKSGLPNKKGSKRYVYQSNIKNISPQSLDMNTQN